MITAAFHPKAAPAAQMSGVRGRMMKDIAKNTKQIAIIELGVRLPKF
jgi:hypothetical protein